MAADAGVGNGHAVEWNGGGDGWVADMRGRE